MARFAESPPSAVDAREGSEGSPHLSFIPKAKVTPPAAALNEVPRATLWSKVVEAGPVPLLLVNAPAGFGKTNTMTQLCERFVPTFASFSCAQASYGSSNLHSVKR
jgi:hypothetical protein